LSIWRYLENTIFYANDNLWNKIKYLLDLNVICDFVKSRQQHSLKVDTIDHYS